MKYAIALLLLSLATSVQAQLLTPKGAKATLVVEYAYTAAGASGRTNDTDALDEWKVRRVVNVTAHYLAQEPITIGVLHEPDAAQQAALDTKQKQLQAFGKKMAPTVVDMMAIADRCGEDDACISKAMADYGNKMDAKQMQAQSLSMPEAPRYQLWKLTSQSGTYEVDEVTSRQVFGTTCTRTKVCKRTVTARGKGPVPLPPGGSLEDTSLLEIDSVLKDLAAKMPMPLQALAVESNVQTTIPGDDFKVDHGLRMRMFRRADFLTLAIPGNSLPASGTTTLQNTGDGAESGTLTVKWSFKRN